MLLKRPLFQPYSKAFFFHRSNKDGIYRPGIASEQATLCGSAHTSATHQAGGAVSGFVRTRVPDLETSPMIRAGRERRIEDEGTRRPAITRARHSTCAREAPPPMCASSPPHLLLFMHGPSVPSSRPSSPTPHRRRRRRTIRHAVDADAAAVHAIRAQLSRRPMHLEFLTTGKETHDFYASERYG